MVKEYLCFEIECEAEGTQRKLNRLAEKGWVLVCSYANSNRYLIMERDIEPCSKCGKNLCNK